MASKKPAAPKAAPTNTPGTKAAPTTPAKNVPKTVPKPQSAPPNPAVVGGYQYPDAFPINSVTEIIRIISGKTVTTEKAAFGKHVWVIQGFAQATLLGDPDAATLNTNLIGGAKVAPKVDAVVDILNGLLKSQESAKLGPQAAPDNSVKIAAPTALASVLQWSVTTLLQLIEQELAAAVI